MARPTVKQAYVRPGKPGTPKSSVKRRIFSGANAGRPEQEIGTASTSRKALPARSNKGGVLKGVDRAEQVKGMNAVRTNKGQRKTPFKTFRMKGK